VRALTDSVQTSFDISLLRCFAPEIAARMCLYRLAGEFCDVSCASFEVQKDDWYTGRERVERRGRDLGLRRCDRVAVEQKFTAD